MKTKVLITIFTLLIITFCLGLTYSYFTADTTMNNVDQKIAKFIFNAEKQDQLEIPITSLFPGQTEEYEFSVTNEQEEIKSDVSVDYQLIIKTPHLTPLIIELLDENNNIVLSCDETYSRNEDNELVCNTDNIEMSHTEGKKDNYKLKITFDENYNDETYSNLIDYIKLEIKSYQKV